MTVDLNNADKPGIILLYDSEQIYQRFVKMFSKDYQIHWGNTLNNTMNVLASSPVAVMVCDIHFHNQAILPVVLALKEMHPEIVPMIVSPASDQSAVAELETEETIFATLVRPVTTERLRQTLAEAVLFHYDQTAVEENTEVEEVAEVTDDEDDEIPPEIAEKLALMSAEIERGMGYVEPEMLSVPKSVPESEPAQETAAVPESESAQETAVVQSFDLDDTESMFEMELELDSEPFAAASSLPKDIAALDAMDFVVEKNDDEDDDFDEVFFVDIQQDER